MFADRNESSDDAALKPAGRLPRDAPSKRADDARTTLIPSGLTIMLRSSRLRNADVPLDHGNTNFIFVPGERKETSHRVT